MNVDNCILKLINLWIYWREQWFIWDVFDFE